MPIALFIAKPEEPAPQAGGGARGADSLGEFVERHSQFVYRIALAVARDPHDAEDAVQETFLQIFRGGRWDEIKDERGYLARVAWRMAVRRRKPRLLEQELPLEIQSSQATPEQSAIYRQQQAWLHSAIDRLPEKLRQPLALAALGELKLVEVAKILRLPEGTVRRRIHTARQKLKQELLDQKLLKQKGGCHER
jgi:RNA polymerase sigma-70 factor (ECF subfamily)